MQDKGKYGDTLKYASLATQWMAMLLVATWIGYKIDSLLKWKFPLFIIFMPLIALCVSMWMLIKQLNKPKK